MSTANHFYPIFYSDPKTGNKYWLEGFIDGNPKLGSNCEASDITILSYLVWALQIAHSDVYKNGGNETKKKYGISHYKKIGKLGSEKRWGKMKSKIQKLG